jgi:predicted amidohydrolase
LTGGQLVNMATGEIYPADVAVAGDIIAAVGDVGPHTGADTTVVDVSSRYLVPGLIDGPALGGLRAQPAAGRPSRPGAAASVVGRLLHPLWGGLAVLGRLHPLWGGCCIRCGAA